MVLLSRIPRDHSVRQFQAAARLRYNEGLRLAAAGDRLAAIYLWGYSAEMLLKAASFRLLGRSPDDPIAVQDLENARRYASQVLGLTWGGNLHYLPGWRDLMVLERHRRGQAYSRTFRRSLYRHVDRVYVNWREHLRYCVNRPYPHEVLTTQGSTDWLLTHFPDL